MKRGRTKNSVVAHPKCDSDVKLSQLSLAKQTLAAAGGNDFWELLSSGAYAIASWFWVMAKMQEDRPDLSYAQRREVADSLYGTDAPLKLEQMMLEAARSRDGSKLKLLAKAVKVTGPQQPHDPTMSMLEAVSQVSERNDEASNMEKGIIHQQRAVVAHDQSAEISQPRKSALDFPALSVASQRPAILRWWLGSVAAVWTDQLDTPGLQLFPQRVAVVAPVGDETLQFALGSTAPTAGHSYLRQGFLDQLYFRGRRAVQVVSQRNTLAVDHHHPLRALAALGFADAVAPFLAGAKLPSMKLSLQSNWPCSSSSARNRRHTLSQTSCSSHKRRRRQQVAGLMPKSEGRSRQRAPVLSTHKIPSSTARLSFHGRPALEYFGSSGSSLAHCWSDNMGFAIPSFSQIRCKSTSSKYLRRDHL